MFELKEGKVIPHPDQLALPFIKVLWDRDKTTGKDSAFKEISYIFYMADYNSPYSNYPETKKKQVILDDIIKDKKWKETPEVILAIQKYKEMSETPEMRLLKTWQNKVDELSDFIAETTIDLDTVDDLLKAGMNTEKIITSIQKLKDIVEKQLTQKSAVRGGKTISLFEG